MSGAGKSALVVELRDRGYTAYDADDDGFSEPRPNGGWGWRADEVRELFDCHEHDLLFFAGCSEEQALFDFDLKVLLTAPEAVISERLKTRRSNAYGRGPGEMDRVLSDIRDTEPVLFKVSDLIVETTVPVRDVADRVLERVSQLLQRGRT